MLSSPSSQFRLNSISAKSADTISEALAAISEKTQFDIHGIVAHGSRIAHFTLKSGRMK